MLDRVCHTLEAWLTRVCSVSSTRGTQTKNEGGYFVRSSLSHIWAHRKRQRLHCLVPKDCSSLNRPIALSTTGHYWMHGRSRLPKLLDVAVDLYSTGARSQPINAKH